MWLLRDSFLEPTINGQTVSVRQYFTQKVLKFQRGMSQKMRTRQELRTILLEMFQKYDAFALPIPHSNKRLLHKLGNISRDKLNPDFVYELNELCQKIMRETTCKMLFSKDRNGNDQYIHCTGHRM